MLNADEIDLFAANLHIRTLMERACDKIYNEDIERTIISIIKKQPEVLRIQDENGINIGMLAADKNFFSVAYKALDDRVASIQQDKNKKNIGMYLAKSTYTDSVDSRDMCKGDSTVDILLTKALKNKLASTQQDIQGYNIGMLVAKRDSKKVLKLALKNEEACMQKNKYGETILDIANKNRLLEKPTKDWSF